MKPKLTVSMTVVVLTALIPLAANSQPLNHWIVNQYRQWTQPPPRGYNLGVPAQPGPPVTREGLNYLNWRGGGLDDRGYYRRPFPASEAFPGLSDGLYRMPMGWDDDPDRALLFEIQGGDIIRQDFQYQR